MKSRIMSFVLAMLAPASLLAAVVNDSAKVDGSSSSFTVSQETMVPGTTLKPGTYTIKVVDHLQDRMILRVEGSNGADHTLFLGVPSHNIKGSSAGPVAYGSGPSGKAALRGFVFDNGKTGVEFIYPKNDAVALAKLNDNKVIAVDPASEGKPAEMANLNHDEMKMVTLWMLTPETVGGGGEPSISAAKYQGKGSSTAASHPAMKSLPHTASLLPLTMLIGMAAACGAFFLRKRRSSRSMGAVA